MPRRRTKRGAERTPLGGDYDVLICGASFAGLAVARELRGARVLIVDRYEVGERQTSACAAPTEWIRALGLEGSMKQTFDRLVVHTPHGTSAWPLPFTFSTFDYPRLCELLDDQNDAEFETAKVNGRTGLHGPHGPRRPDGAADRGRARLAPRARRRRATSRPTRRSRAGSRCIRTARATTSSSGSTARTCRPATAGASPPNDELRIGVGSFDPRYHVKEPTVRLAEDLGEDAVRYQGNWIPHKIRPAAEDGIFFAGDSAGHCLPLTAEGIRTAWYFGIACGRELQRVVDGTATRDEALATLRRLQPAARLEVRLDAARAAHRPARPAAAPARRRRRDGPPRALALGVRPLPEDRAAAVRSACRAPRWRSRSR